MCGPDQKDKGTPMYRVVPSCEQSLSGMAGDPFARAREAHLRAQMRCLARNLRDAGALEFARLCGYRLAEDPTQWMPTAGAAPGWTS
jgi:hypothetical protein